MSDAEKLLRELIALPSVNPAFLPDGHTYAGEKRVAEFLISTAAAAGLDVEFQSALPQRSNVLAVLSPTDKPKQRIVLAPHMDTVNVVSEKQFRPTRQGDKLFGRGACDTKGSIACMISALSRMARNGQRPRQTEIVFAGLIDEENGQSGSRAFAKAKWKADLAIVGEPTQLKVVTAHKGSLWLRLETHGKAAHGSCPELGRNAVHEMARVVNVLETEYAKALKRKKHSLLGTGTVNVGFMQGGSQPNIVPDACVIGVDRRTIPGETEAGVKTEIQKLLKRHGLKATLGSEKSSYCYPLETNPHLPLVQQFLRTAKQPKPAGVKFFCDASILAQAGIPSIVFGPGNIAQAHTVDEWISIKSLERATDLLHQFLISLP